MGSGSGSPAIHCHPERQRRISVRVVSVANGSKYQSAGWLYSRRGLPLRGRGTYGPVLMHGPRVVAADAAGAEALVGVLKIIKDAFYNKTREPPLRAMEKRHPPLLAGATTFPPASLVGLWVLTNVPHESKGKRRAVLFSPLNRGESRAAG